MYVLTKEMCGICTGRKKGFTNVCERCKYVVNLDGGCNTVASHDASGTLCEDREISLDQSEHTQRSKLRVEN